MMITRRTFVHTVAGAWSLTATFVASGCSFNERRFRGFGGEVDTDFTVADVLERFQAEPSAPIYIAEARTYVVPYPKEAVESALGNYPRIEHPNLEAGVVALYQKCTHLGCKVPWCETSQWFECPCHGSQYNAVGEKKGGPAPRGLDRFPVRFRGKKRRMTIDTENRQMGMPIGTDSTKQAPAGPHCIGGG